MFFQRFPFDWRSPFGFLVAIAIQYVMVTYFLVIAAPILIMVIASYLYCIAVSKIVKRGLLHINRNAQAKEIDQSTLLEQIIESLKMYSCMKQLSATITFCIAINANNLTPSFPDGSPIFQIFFNISAQ